MVFYPVDGSDCQQRTFRIQDVDTIRQRFTISIYEKDDAGCEAILENYQVGVGEDDKDDMGVPAYIETVFETRSSHFRCDLLERTTWEKLEPVLLSLKWKKSTPRGFSFSGGTDGGIPELPDWLQAASVFSNEHLQLNLLFAAGNVEPDFIVKLAEIADDRHVSFFDAPTNLSPAQALEWVKELGLKSRHSRCYYSALEANDPWRGGKTVWAYPGPWPRQRPLHQKRPWRSLRPRGTKTRLDKGRRYTGNHRKYLIENAREICHSPATREKIRSGKLSDFMGMGAASLPEK